LRSHAAWSSKKASKSRGNVLDPNYLFDSFGSDAVRWYFYTAVPVGENYRTGDAALRELLTRSEDEVARGKLLLVEDLVE